MRAPRKGLFPRPGAVAIAGSGLPCPLLISVGRRRVNCAAARPPCAQNCCNLLHIAKLSYICGVIVFERKVTNLLIISHESQINESTSRENSRGPRSRKSVGSQSI